MMFSLPADPIEFCNLLDDEMQLEAAVDSDIQTIYVVEDTENEKTARAFVSKLAARFYIFDLLADMDVVKDDYVDQLRDSLDHNISMEFPSFSEWVYQIIDGEDSSTSIEDYDILIREIPLKRMQEKDA